MIINLSVHILSVASAIVLSLRYASVLRISIKEMPRYLRKSFNLALCYIGFVSEPNYHQATRAGVAAFLCCAYDVVTDWQKFHGEEIGIFDDLLKQNAPELRRMALDLLEKDLREELSYDGLERGIVSTQFITELIGSRLHFEKIMDIEQIGMALQVVDDVLDFEADIHSGDTNCLSSPRWRQYLMLLEKTLPEQKTVSLFPHGKVLRSVIKQTHNKALIVKSQLNQNKT